MEFKNVPRLVLALVLATSSQAREVNTNASTPFEGHLNSVTKNTVHYITESDSVRSVLFSTLSNEDKKYISDWQLAKKQDDLVFQMTKKRVSTKTLNGMVYESFRYDGKLTNQGATDLSGLSLNYSTSAALASILRKVSRAG